MKTRRRNPDYDPNWDYEVRPRPLADVAKAVAGARSIANIYASLLDMQPPTIHYVADTGDHVARYINGTSSSPVVVVNDKALAKWAKKYRVALSDAAESTLIHEMGHAYVDSMGLSGELADEERIVEEPASIFFRSMDIEAAANQLRHAVAGKAKTNPRARRAKAPRRENGFLASLALVGIGMAAGVYVEERQGVAARVRSSLKGKDKVAREQFDRLKRGVLEAKPRARATLPAPRSSRTDPAWVREESPDGKGYTHARTMKGTPYEVFERVYGKGRKSIFLDVGEAHERVNAPNGQEDGWANVAAAKRAAEALAGM